jgi:ribosomal-protein-alanine N-acetyltransferase
MDIRTSRLILRPMPANFLRASAEGATQARLSALLGLNVAADWLPEGELAALRLEDLQLDPEALPWSVRAVALHHSGEMIGHAGFHTRPSPGYPTAWVPDAVEVGYVIYPPYRRQGYAYEALVALIRWAHVEAGVSRVLASVSPGNPASCALLAHAGFRCIASFVDDVDSLQLVMLLDCESALPFVR